MQAVVYRTYGGPEVLELAEVAVPNPSQGEIRISVRGSSLNAVDSKLRSGLMAGGAELAAPGRPGFDAAGVVEQVGAGVTGVQVGDEVFGLGSGTAAASAILEVWAAKPVSVPWESAAAAGVAVETTGRALELLGVEAGTTVLIDGATGGVGAVAVQVSVARGARVIGSGSAANQDYLSQLGAEPVLYGDGLVDRVRTLAPDGVDAVFDVAGRTSLESLASLVTDPAQVVSIANFSGGAEGTRVTSSRSPRAAEFLAEGARLLASGDLQIEVTSFPLDQVVEAATRSERGGVRGKIVLVPQIVLLPQ